MSYRSLDQIIIADVVRGLPKVSSTHQNFCGPCRVGKQTRVSHKLVQILEQQRIPNSFIWI